MSVVIGTRYSAVSALFTNPNFSSPKFAPFLLFFRRLLRILLFFVPFLLFFHPFPCNLLFLVPFRLFLSTTKFLSCLPRLLLTLPLVPTLSGVVVIQRVLNIRPTVVAKAIRQNTEDLNTEDLNTEDLNSEVFFLLDYEQCY